MYTYLIFNNSGNNAIPTSTPLSAIHLTIPLAFSHFFDLRSEDLTIFSNSLISLKIPLFQHLQCRHILNFFSYITKGNIDNSVVTLLPP